MGVSEMSLAEIAQIVKDLGLTGGLIVGIWLLIKGKLVPRQTVDEMREHANAQTKLLAQEITKEFSEGLQVAVKEGVKEGTIAAVEHLNGGNV
jgi:hypothetical protein